MEKEVFLLTINREIIISLSYLYVQIAIRSEFNSSIYLKLNSISPLANTKFTIAHVVPYNDIEGWI